MRLKRKAEAVCKLVWGQPGQGLQSPDIQLQNGRDSTSNLADRWGEEGHLSIGLGQSPVLMGNKWN